MAKSLRSKWKRKMRAVKREQYAKKDLIKLKAMVEAAEKKEEEEKLYKMKKPLGEVEMAEVENEASNEVQEMQVDKVKPKYNTKTFKNEHGNYPIWMNHRRQRKMKKSNARKKAIKKKGKK